MASVCQVGGYTFADNEINLVSFSRQTRFSPRNKKLSEVRTIHCEGELIYADTATIVSKIIAVENALRDDYKDFRYTVGGTLAHSLLNSSDCVSGVKIIQKAFPKGDPAQLATTRSISFTMQGTYDAAETDLVSWTESIETLGTGGPKFFILETAYLPIALYTTINSAQFYQQSGQAVGYTNYPQEPGPVNPAGEFQDRRKITKISGRNMGNAIRFYTKKWSYFMGRDTGTFGGVDFSPTSQ